MKLIIPIIVGAIIGYVTNWLAIKMLFRPHYEKKVMGIKIPFTPGLIPKEKARIAKNIGETVGEYLLSPEAIGETLLSEETNSQIKLWIEARVNRLKYNKSSMKDLLISLPGNADDKVIGAMEESIKGLIIEQIRGERFKSTLLSFISEKLYDDRIYNEISKNIRIFLENILNSEELKLVTEDRIGELLQRISKDERILIEVVPEKMNLELDKYLDENIEEIGEYIRQVLNSPDIENKLKASISNMVDQNVSRLITSFIPSESISEKIYLAIEKYINDPNSNKDILLIIKSLLDRIMGSKVSELTSSILNRLNPVEVSRYILDYIRNMENQDMIINIIDEKMKETNKEKIIEKLSQELDTILSSDKLSKQVSLFINYIMVEIMDKPIINVLDKAEYDYLKIYDFIKTIFDNFIANQLPQIVELFNISKIVEDEINKFDVEFTEKLILDIANKELKAITWLGALLGGIMGLLSPLLQML